jgi:hypothetical protein
MSGPALIVKAPILPTNRLTLLSGAVPGVLVSISSVGAGAIGVTVLTVC